MNGAQAERTRLAWRRTVLAATVVTVLCVRYVLRDGPGHGAGLLAAGFALAWVGLCAGAQARIRALARDRPTAIDPLWPLAACLMTLALAALGLVAVW